MAISDSKAPRSFHKTPEMNSAVFQSNVTENVEEEDEKPRTLFVGNVPREVHKREIEDIFGEIGPLKRCYIQYPRDGNEKKKQREDTTVAYVTFALSQDATKALETLQSTKMGNNRINIKFAKTRSEQVRQPFGAEGGDRFARSANLEPLAGVVAKVKEPRPKPIKKKSRLIVRNLSFKVTEEKLREYFQGFGDIKDVNILKKPNGKLVGCAFIQYQNIFQAANAIKELNLKPFLGRPIAIDWALPKEKYQTEDEKNQKSNAEASETTSVPGDNISVIKDEPESESESQSDHFNALDPYDYLKQEPADDEEIKVEPQLQVSNASKRKFTTDDSDMSDDDSSSENEEKQRPSTPKRRKQVSNDVEEGKTLFIRNLSFDTKEDELTQFFEKFGPLQYALLCKDPLTEHPKGTGFVKFNDKAAADKCLQQYNEDVNEFILSRRHITVSVALSKERLGSKPEDQEDGNKPRANKKDNTPKSDSRNLYLVREGFVRPGSAASVDVSVSDMNKRATLNRVKKQMLRNLNIFLSPTRICVHNLPLNYSDTQLRKLFKKHAGHGAKVLEAKVMRDMKDIDLNGKGKSKGYGFVNFKEHEHALTALRAINNNPTVFKPTSRPIVEFSLENRMAIKAKEKRALKSKEKNPNSQLKNQVKQNKAGILKDSDDESEIETFDKEEQGKQKEKGSKKKAGIKNQEREKDQVNQDGNKTEEQVAPKYAGLVAKKGVKTVPSFKAKGKITRNSLKMKKSKKGRKLQERKQREPKVPSKRPLEKVDKTEKMITKYKQKIHAADRKNEGGKKKKWFQ